MQNTRIFSLFEIFRSHKSEALHLVMSLQILEDKKNVQNDNNEKGCPHLKELFSCYESHTRTLLLKHEYNDRIWYETILLGL